MLYDSMTQILAEKKEGIIFHTKGSYHQESPAFWGVKSVRASRREMVRHLKQYNLEAAGHE